MDKSKIKEFYELYFDMVYKICYLYTKNEADSADITQEVFYRLIKYAPSFETNEKAKAWFIVTASNCCKTLLKKWWYRPVTYPAESENTQMEFKDNSVLEAVLSLDKKYSVPIYLYYYEGYKTAEIGAMLNEKPSTIQTRLAKARELLKLELEE